MNNTTTTTIDIDSKLNIAVDISHIIWRSCGFLCILFGIPGHSLQILMITNKTYRKELISLYSTAIAICELIFLLGVFWLWCVAVSITKIDPRQILSCGIFYNIIIGPTILSNLYLASFFIDRTFLILSPARYRLLITRRHVLIRIFLILIIVIIFMIPHHFYYYYNKNTTIFLCEFYPSITQWRIRIWPFLHAILFVVIPSIIICISSIILTHNRSNHRKIHNNKLSENARRMERNSKLILIMSITIFFSILPFVILQIFIVHEHLFQHGAISPIRWKIYQILLNCCMTLATVNYSFKFYIRLGISKTFRREFLQLINCICHKKEQNLIPLHKQKLSKDIEI